MRELTLKLGGVLRRRPEVGDGRNGTRRRQTAAELGGKIRLAAAFPACVARRGGGDEQGGAPEMLAGARGGSEWWLSPAALAARVRFRGEEEGKDRVAARVPSGGGEALIALERRRRESWRAAVADGDGQDMEQLLRREEEDKEGFSENHLGF